MTLFDARSPLNAGISGLPFGISRLVFVA